MTKFKFSRKRKKNRAEQGFVFYASLSAVKVGRADYIRGLCERITYAEYVEPLFRFVTTLETPVAISMRYSLSERTLSSLYRKYVDYFDIAEFIKKEESL